MARRTMDNKIVKPSYYIETSATCGANNRDEVNSRGNKEDDESSQKSNDDDTVNGAMFIATVDEPDKQTSVCEPLDTLKVA